MSRRVRSIDDRVISYMTLYKLVGFLGVSLPVVVIALGFIERGPGLEPSISHYYDLGSRDVFVGILCAIASFLVAYRGPERKDDIAGKIAAVCAVGVAWIPHDGRWSSVHALCAGGMLITLAYFSLALFTKKGKCNGYRPTRQKEQRNVVYRACGVIIAACIACLYFYYRLELAWDTRWFKPVLMLETVALWAFGVSWFVKGEVILRDKT